MLSCREFMSSGDIASMDVKEREVLEEGFYMSRLYVAPEFHMWHKCDKCVGGRSNMHSGRYEKGCTTAPYDTADYDVVLTVDDEDE